MFSQSWLQSPHSERVLIAASSAITGFMTWQTASYKGRNVKLGSCTENWLLAVLHLLRFGFRQIARPAYKAEEGVVLKLRSLWHSKQVCFIKYLFVFASSSPHCASSILCVFDTGRKKMPQPEGYLQFITFQTMTMFTRQPDKCFCRVINRSGIMWKGTKRPPARFTL